MFGTSDDIRKETKNKTESDPCYGGCGGRLSYEMLRSKNRSARFARIVPKITSAFFFCMFFGGLGAFAGMMIYQMMQGNFVLRPVGEEKKISVASSDGVSLADSITPLSVTSGGAEMVSVTKEFSERYRIPMGALVKELSTENAGYAAGVREGDIIVMIDSTEVLGTEEFSKFADVYADEESIQVRVFRDGEYHDFVVELNQTEFDS